MYVYVFMIPSVVAAVIPGCFHWWLALDETRSKGSAWILRGYKRIPAWDLLMWLSTPRRAVKVAAFLFCSSVAGVVFVNLFIRSPALQQPTSHPAIPFLLAGPFGLITAVVIMSMHLDRPQFAAIQQSRLTRLANSTWPIFCMSAVAWILACVVSMLVYLIAPTPLPNVLDGVLACGASFCYTLSLLSSSHLAGIVLSERPALPPLQASEQSLVRISALGCNGGQQPLGMKLRGVVG
jgi:hypothetical protein